MNNETNNDTYFMLSILANICQLGSFDMNLRDLTNNDIMKELQKQNGEYLEKIIKQNETIIMQNNEILKRLNK